MSLPLTVGIVGVSGYSGMELARILSRHPDFRLAWGSSDRWAGQTLAERAQIDGETGALTVIAQEQAHDLFGKVDLVFLCTPPEVSLELAPRVLAAGARVVDLSGAFRLPAEAYPQWYGLTHSAPDLLKEAVYCLPEATGNREALKAARLVSNPGCYPTVSSLPLIPLLRAGLIDTQGIIIDAKSGTTGAGRKATEAMSFSEVADDFRAYKVLRHQHTPEIERILALSGHPGIKVTFTAHLLPVRRGILATVYARLKKSADGTDPDQAVEAAMRAFAAESSFLHVVSPENVSLRGVVGTNRVLMGARTDVDRGVVVIAAAEDNLVKGAAGQAVQNANMMFGLPETRGLYTLVGHQP